MDALKANELRTENLLMHDGEVVIIDSIQQSLLSVNGTNYWELKKDFQPIPITEDWLIRFGFEKDKRSGDHVEVWYYGENPYTHDWMISIKKTDGFYYYRNAHFALNYVHQLQNLFYCLSGKELEINL